MAYGSIDSESPGHLIAVRFLGVGGQAVEQDVIHDECGGAAGLHHQETLCVLRTGTTFMPRPRASLISLAWRMGCARGRDHRLAL